MATLAITSLGYALHYLPFAPFAVASPQGIRRPISAAILAILLGALARNLFDLPNSVSDGAKKIVRKLLPYTIILTGASLNLAAATRIGLPSRAIIVICLTIATVASISLGAWFRTRERTALLIGAGTAICGTSAIIAVAPLIDAEDDDLTLSAGTVNLLGLVLMFSFPALGAYLNLSAEAYGVWAGTSIHAVPQVVAAGFAHSTEAGAVATLIKLVRVALLAPMAFLIAVIYARRRAGTERRKINYWQLIPTFIWGFLGLAVLNTLGLLTMLHVDKLVNEVSTLLLTIAMAAIGLEVNARSLAKTGGGALATGVACCLLLCLTSLALIRLLL